MTIKGPMGADATKAIKEHSFMYGKKVTREAMTVWNTESQKRLMEAAGQRAGMDAQRDQRGSLEGRQDHQLHEIAQSFTVPKWDGDKWMFAVTHATAGLHEWGAQPHEIEAKKAQALAFEWPDAPDEIKEKFESSYPTVFFDKVQHPGVPAIGYLRYGRAQARERLSDAGFDAEAFGLGGDD